MIKLKRQTTSNKGKDHITNYIVTNTRQTNQRQHQAADLEHVFDVPEQTLADIIVKFPIVQE